MLQTRQIITMALSRIGAINFGENPDTSTSDIALQVLRVMLDEFDIRYSNFKLYNHLTTAKNIITLGTDESNILLPISGDIADRPSIISEVVAKIGSINYPLSIKPYREYNNLPITNINAIPTTVYIDYGFPYVSLYFFPGFGMSAQVLITGRGYTTDTLTLNDYIEYPREWSAAILSQLALRLAPYFGVPTSQDLIIQASSDLKHVKQLAFGRNIGTLNCDMTGRTGFNVLAGR